MQSFSSNNFDTDNLNPYSASAFDGPAINAEESARVAFIRRTYAHLTGAVMALLALETVLFVVIPAQQMDALAERMLSGMGWLVVLGLFMGVSWIARMWATSSTSKTMQYAGLGLYVVAEAIILLPLLYICIRVMGDPMIPVMAAAISSICFMGLTVFVFAT